MEFPGSNSADLEKYKKSLNINMVRLAIHMRQYAKQQGVSGDQTLAAGIHWGDVMLDTCAKLGIAAVINVSQFPLDPAQPDQSTAAFWNNPSALDDVITAAGKLSAHFHKRGTELAGYDIMSEPLLITNRATPPPLWPKLLDRIITEIRKSDAERWIIVAPGPGGGPKGYESFSPPGDSHIIWGVHMYLPHAFTHQGIKNMPLAGSYPGRIGVKYWDIDALRNSLKPLRDFQIKNGGPVWVGEFSAVRWAKGGEQYIRDLADIFNDYGWGWSYFSASGWHGWNPDYNDMLGDNQQAKKQLMGGNSPRWKMLRTIFFTRNTKTQP